jgi:hypothetical protein
MFRFLTCPGCSVKLRVENAFAGAFACPRCGCRIKVAAPPPPKAVEVAAPPEEPVIRVFAAEAPPVSSAVRDLWRPEEREPEEEEPPSYAPRSLWRGVFTFPWHLGTLRVWFLLTAGLLVFVLLGVALHALLLFYRETTVLLWQGLLERIVPYFAAALALAGLWTGSYAAADFLAVIQETAAGNRDVEWPDESLFERLARLAYLAWVGACIASPFAFAAFVLGPYMPGGIVPWLVFTAPWGVVFPLILLGLLSNGGHWVLFWNAGLVLRLAHKPYVVLVLCLVSPLLLLPCVVLGYATIGLFWLPLAPVTAAVWAAVLLVYARLLGRVAWVVSDDPEVPRKRRKRRRAAE